MVQTLIASLISVRDTRPPDRLNDGDVLRRATIVYSHDQWPESESASRLSQPQCDYVTKEAVVIGDPRLRRRARHFPDVDHVL
eukprot:16159619-Heterocapsa_arctica.AAC.1